MTTWAQITADKLGVPFEDVDVLHGDTAISPLGMDTYGSRSLSVGGVALWYATEKVLAKARLIAAHELEVADEDLEWRDGAFRVKGAPDRAKTIPELAFSAWTAHALPEGVEPTLEATSVWDPPNFTFPSGTHVCVVEVDTETGETEIVRYVAVDDCGEVINPMIVDGQIHGGIAQGIAEAMYEEAVYDEHGSLVTNSMLSYAVPSAAELPRYELERTVTPSTTNPMGVKGIGEAGTIASPPAVVNAVADALLPFGVTTVEKPVTPERVWRAIQEREGGDMIPAEFEYQAADSVEHAIELLGSNADARLIAGGQSLLPLMKLRLSSPALLVDLNGVDGLAGVREDGDTLAIGALTRHEDLHRDATVAKRCPLLAHAAGEVGDPQVRHRGTLGGSLAHAAPEGDLPAALLALDGELVVRGPEAVSGRSRRRTSSSARSRRRSPRRRC